MTKGWLISLNHGTGFKAPTFNDLYSPFGGNPSLLPETSNTSEVLVKGEQYGVTFEVALYDTEVENLIRWVNIEPESEWGFWTPGNVDSAEIQGMDLTLSTNLASIDWQFTATLLDTKNNTTGTDLIRRPEQNSDFRHPTFMMLGN